MAEEVGHFIAGKRVVGKSGRFGDVFNPATGESHRPVAFADSSEIDAAVKAARDAFPAWAATPPISRARVMFKYKELLEQNRDKLARHDRQRARQGAGRCDRRGHARHRGRRVRLRHPAAAEGRVHRAYRRRYRLLGVRQPLGVCAGITPFNFPAMVPMWMFPVAIACGNSFVLKPSERDPSPALLLAELLAQAGLPDGVFNVVNGDKSAVDALLDHPGIDAVSFVGSTPIAEHVYPPCQRQRQARAGAGRRQEPHGGDARCRHGPGGRCADGRGLRLGRRALHGGLGRGRRRRGRRRADREARAARAQPEARPRHRSRRRDGPAGHARGL